MVFHGAGGQACGYFGETAHSWIVIAIVCCTHADGGCCVASNFKQCETSIGMDITINIRIAMYVTFLMLWVNCGYLTVPEMKMGCFPSTVRCWVIPFFRTRGVPPIVWYQAKQATGSLFVKNFPWSWKKLVLRFGENKNTCLSHDRVELSRGSFSNE